MARKRARSPRGKGSVTRRGEWWQIRWREGGKRCSARFDREDVARDTLTEKLGNIANGLGLRRAGIERPAPAGPKDMTTLAAMAADWLDRRQHTHRSARNDSQRWSTHLGPFFNDLRPEQVDEASLRRFIEEKLKTGLSSTTVGHCVRTLSSLFTDLKEQKKATRNPVGDLPRSTKRLYRSAHDPRTTPFLERAEDIRRVYLALQAKGYEQTAVAFAIGALAGLRTGEVLGLAWEHIDLQTRRMQLRQQVQRGRLGPLKDDDSRMVPILDPLLPILRAWHLRTGGKGLLFKPRHARRGGRPELGVAPAFMREQTLNKHLRQVLKELGLQPADLKLLAPAARLNWYRCTRHTFSARWVLDGGSIEKLQVMLGHEDVSTTQRYAHLRADLFTPADLATVQVDLSPAAGKVVDLVDAANGGTSGTNRVRERKRRAAAAGASS